MPKYIFSDGKVRVEEDKYSPLLTPKQQFTDSVVFLLLNKKIINVNETSVNTKEKDDVRKEQ